MRYEGDSSMMNTAEAVRRARSALKRKTIYHLGSGGADPAAAHPAEQGRCDCSGYACWCLGIARERSRNVDSRIASFPRAWINTDAIADDAKSTRTVFERVTDAQAGDLIVYGKMPGEDYGHVGVVTEAKYGMPARVAHCCARTGLASAILEEDAKVFWIGAMRSRGAIFARFKAMTPETPLRRESEEELENVTIEVNGRSYPGRFDGERNVNLVPLDSVKELLPKGTSFIWHNSEAPKRLEIIPPKER
jgi:hypothetical protein